MKKNILITGANGFVGSALISYLNKKNYNIYGMVRKKIQNDLNSVNNYTLNDLLKIENKKILYNTDTIIHAAGRAHIRFPFLKKNSDKLFYDNVKLTAKLADITIKNNIKNFIFISSAKVYGEESQKKSFYDENNTLNPQQKYSVSKYDAELKLLQKFKTSSTNLTIIRPPMIYGKVPNGNLKILIWAIKFYIPIPIPKTPNQRSFLGLENLCLFIEKIITKKIKNNLIHNLSDGIPISTKQLTDSIGYALNRKVRYITIPDFALNIFLQIPIISNIFKPLFRNFVIKSLYDEYLQNKLSIISTEKLIYKKFLTFK